MKDQADCQTVDLFQAAKRSRGRPVTGQAMTNAERQKKYRQNLKLKTVTVTEKQGQGAYSSEIDFLNAIIDKLKDDLDREKCFHAMTLRASESYRKQLEDLNQAHHKLLVKHNRLLKKRNVTESN